MNDVWVEKGSSLGIHYSESQSNGGCIYYQTKHQPSSTFEFQTYGNMYNEGNKFDNGWTIGHRLTFSGARDWERAASIHVEICGSYINKGYKYIYYIFI